MNIYRFFCKIKNSLIITAVVFITAVFLLSCGQEETTVGEILTVETTENAYIKMQNKAEQTVSDRILMKADAKDFYKAFNDTKEIVSGQKLTKFYVSDINLPEYKLSDYKLSVYKLQDNNFPVYKLQDNNFPETDNQAVDAEKDGLLDTDSLRQNLPEWVRLSQKNLSAEENINIQLTEGKLELKQKSGLIWESGDSILVQDFLWCDIDGDEGNELLLLCWKQGKYGKHKPFWIEEDDTGISQHIFIYDWDGEQISQLWLASDIGMEITQWTYDEHGFLIALDSKGETSSWAWISWGLEAVDTSVTFAAVGDDLIHMQIVGCGKQKGNYDFMFEHIKDMVQQADIAVINQETMFVDNPAQYSGYPRFGSPAAIGDAIKNAGFDVVTCGTNHSMDKGMEGINTTYRKLGDLGLVVLGIQGEEPAENADDVTVSENAGNKDSEKPVSENVGNKDDMAVSENAGNKDDMAVSEIAGNKYDGKSVSEYAKNDEKPYEIITRKRIRFAMLNYTYGTNGLPVPASHPDAVNLLTEEEKIRQDLRLARDDADMVIVFVHWGTEYQNQPDAFQEKWTEVFLEEGVDVVVGTHPHVMQPYEMLQGEDGHEMLVYYSLGNFISAQDSIETVLGGFAEFTISITMDGCKITAYDMLPLVTHQQKGEYTTYFLKDYTEELAGNHRLCSSGLTLLKLQEVSTNIEPE